MAAVMPCDGPDDDQSVFLVQNIAEAEVMTFCLPCMLDFSQALLQQFAPDRLAPPPAKRGRKPRGGAVTVDKNGSGGGDVDGKQDAEKVGQATG